MHGKVNNFFLSIQCKIIYEEKVLKLFLNLSLYAKLIKAVAQNYFRSIYMFFL